MRIVDDFPLPIKTVSENEKKIMEATLRNSNRILKRHHEIAKQQGFVGNRRSFFASVCQGNCAHEIPKAEMDEILKAKNLEHDFLGVYSRLLFKISWKWTARLDKSLTRDDICAAAVEGFLKAFCCFTEDEIRFSSYLTSCVERHISEFVSSFQNQFSLPLEVFKLRVKVRRMMSQEGLTFDSALERMNLSKKTVDVLVQSMCEVTSLGLETAEAKNTQSTQNPEEFINSFQGEFSGLSDLVFQEFVRVGDDINLSEISRNTINPKTGKPYSKMSMSLAWKKVRDKISERYSRVA
jgi:hypothetical protein